MIVLVMLLGAVVGVLLLYAVDHLEAWRLLPKDDLSVQPILLPRWSVILSIGGVFGLLYGQYPSGLQLIVALCTASFLALIVLIDLRYRFILNLMIYPALPVTLGVHLLLGHSLGHVLVGGIFALTIFLGTALVSSGGLGMGDVKLAALIGLMLGFPGVLWALLVGVGAGGAFAVFLLLRRHSRKLTMPYAPFLCFGAAVALLYNPFILLP